MHTSTYINNFKSSLFFAARSFVCRCLLIINAWHRSFAETTTANTYYTETYSSTLAYISHTKLTSHTHCEWQMANKKTERKRNSRKQWQAAEGAYEKKENNNEIKKMIERKKKKNEWVRIYCADITVCMLIRCHVIPSIYIAQACNIPKLTSKLQQQQQQSPNTQSELPQANRSIHILASQIVTHIKWLKCSPSSRTHRHTHTRARACQQLKFPHTHWISVSQFQSVHVSGNRFELNIGAIEIKDFSS